LTIPRETLRKVAAIIPRLGSNHEGEIVAAARALERTLASANQGFSDLANTILPPSPVTQPLKKSAPDWRQTARWCAAYGVGVLNERELEFVDDLARSRGFRSLSPRQEAWLTSIMSKLSMRGAA
jgi:hypothetical protein